MDAVELLLWQSRQCVPQILEQGDVEECWSWGHKYLECCKHDKQRLMGYSPRSTEDESTHKSWVHVDLTLQTSEGKKSWLGECAGWHSCDILAKQQQQQQKLALFYPCSENLGEVELKIMDKTVWQREFQDRKVFDMFNSSWWIDFPGLQWKRTERRQTVFLKCTILWRKSCARV